MGLFLTGITDSAKQLYKVRFIFRRVLFELCLNNLSIISVEGGGLCIASAGLSITEQADTLSPAGISEL